MLSDKNIIVTGSSSGIGLSITKALLKKKANVFGISRRNPNFSNKNYQVPQIFPSGQWIST